MDNVRAVVDYVHEKSSAVKRAVLLVSHGTVDDLDDLPAFVTNVRRGHAAPPELVAELRRRYEAIGGSSPLNRHQCRGGREARGVASAYPSPGPTACGSRRWPRCSRASSATGATHVAVVPLAQHSAHVYAEDARRAAQAAGLAVELHCASDWGQRPDLCSAFARRITAALEGLDRARTTVVMTAHSLPRSVVRARRPVRARGARLGRGHREARRARPALDARLPEPGDERRSRRVARAGSALDHRRRRGAAGRGHRLRAHRVSRGPRRDPLRPRHRGGRDRARQGASLRARAARSTPMRTSSSVLAGVAAAPAPASEEGGHG